MKTCLCLALLALSSTALADPFGPADRASAENLLASLGQDPFADEPLRALERIYDRGPGRAALVAEMRRRAGAGAAADLIVLGRLELEQGRREAGAQSFAAAAARTKDPSLLRRLARLLDDAGDRPQAIAAYQAGLAGAGPLEKRGIELRLGALLLVSGKPADARALWDDAKRSAPGDQALRRQIAEALAERGHYRDAIDELAQLETLVDKEPSAHVAVLRREADFARRAGDRALADRLLVRAYLVAGQLPGVGLRSELTVELFNQHHIDRAASARDRARGLEELTAVARRAEKADPAAAALLGEVLAQGNHRADAIAAFRRALAHRPQDSFLLRRLSSLETGDQRIRDLSALFDADRSDATIGLDLVSALFAAKREGEAIAAARKLRDRFSDNPVLLGEAARLLGKNGQHEEALAFDEQVAKLDPDSPDAAVACGDELIALGRKDEAVRSYFKMVSRDGSSDAYRRLVTLLGRRKLPSEVKRAYAEGLGKNPDDNLLRRDYARWLMGSKDPAALDEASAQWKKIADTAKDPLLRDFASYELQSIEREKIFR